MVARQIKVSRLCILQWLDRLWCTFSIARRRRCLFWWEQDQDNLIYIILDIKGNDDQKRLNNKIKSCPLYWFCTEVNLSHPVIQDMPKLNIPRSNKPMSRPHQVLFSSVVLLYTRAKTFLQASSQEWMRETCSLVSNSDLDVRPYSWE